MSEAVKETQAIPVISPEELEAQKLKKVSEHLEVPIEVARMILRAKEKFMKAGTQGCLVTNSLARISELKADMAKTYEEFKTIKGALGECLESIECDEDTLEDMVNSMGDVENYLKEIIKEKGFNK